MGTVTSISGARGYLLDTHTFLWAAQMPALLGSCAQGVIEDMSHKLYLSPISAYEIVNKYRLGKLEAFRLVVDNYTEIMRKLGAIELPVTLAHAYQAGQMEWEHRDPFDRMLVSQAALEDLVLITQDTVLVAHPWVETIW